jgi:hypothetical protein
LTHQMDSLLFESWIQMTPARKKCKHLSYSWYMLSIRYIQSNGVFLSSGFQFHTLLDGFYKS